VHQQVAAEVKAVRTAVGIMDITAFTKVIVRGRGASEFIDRLIANRLPAEPGRMVLTHLLNERGRIEMEVTCVRLEENAYYFVCAAFFEQRLLDHFQKYLNSEENTDAIEVINHSSEWSALTLNGPHSRKVLAACTDASLENSDFPWLRTKHMAVAGHNCLAMRLSYAGELGWELHMPNAAALDVYKALWQAGKSLGIRDYGSFTMNVMRMEKMFKGAGELTNEVTLPEADVMRFVNLEKDFVGKQATEISIEKTPPWLCTYLEIEADGVNDGNGGEAVLMDGQVVGSVASIVFGHTVDKVLAFSYVKPEAATPGQLLEVIIAGDTRAAVVRAKPLYDPEGLLPKGLD